MTEAPPSQSEPQPEPKKRKLLSWQRLLLILGTLCYAVLMTLIWMQDEQRQQNVMLTFLVTVLFGCFLFAWAVLLSRWRWPARVALLAAIPVLMAVAWFSLRVEGVSGDLVPILSWSWSQPRDLPDAPQQPVALSEPPPAMVDYRQFMGPKRSGMLSGPILGRDWTLKGPREIWRRPVGPGWSGFAVAGSRAVTQEQRGDNEAITCYDANNGATLWIHEYPAKYGNAVAGEGPRATPTIHDDRVFSLGSTGVLTCVDLATGSQHWLVDTVSDNSGRVLEWGISCSPLVTGNLVLVTVPGISRSLVAYDIMSGERVWRSGQDTASYASPLLHSLAGQEQLLIVHTQSVAGYDPASGEQLWSLPWSGLDPKVAHPLPVTEDRLFVTAGYGLGCMLIDVNAGEEGQLQPSAVRRGRAMKAKFCNVVRYGDSIYGLDDGILACIDINTLRRRWKDGRYGHGQLVLVDDLLVIQAESGEVVLVEASPDAHRELGRIEAMTDKTWNTLAIAGKYLLVRNDREAVCYELPLAEDIRAERP